MRNITSIIIIVFMALAQVSWAQDHGEDKHSHDKQEQHDDHHSDGDHAQVSHDDHGDHHDDHHGGDCGAHHDYDPTSTAYHHIGDANAYSIGPLHLPLPLFLYSKQDGWSMFSSGKFKASGHGNGSVAYKRYVMFESKVRRVIDESFPSGVTDLECVFSKTENGKEVVYAKYNGQNYRCENKSTADFGLFGGGITNFFDFSITKNVVSMFVIFSLMFWMFMKAARGYVTREGQAPKGIQSFFEPLITFIRNDVAIPFLGDKYKKYMPFLLSLFFFILGLNLWGQIPFFGGANVTGNLAFTAVLAIITFLVVSFSGNKHYWEHVFWMPGVPWWVKIILTPVEILGLFIKPLTLMLRLFANITAGHIVLLSFIGLIFIFGKNGMSLGGGIGGVTASLPLVVFMSAIELLVAFIQAFVFTILSASYIGAAVEEHH